MNFFFPTPIYQSDFHKMHPFTSIRSSSSLKKVPFFRLPSVPTCPALSCFYPVYMLSCTSYYLHLANIKFSTLIWAVVLYTLICNLSSKWVGANFVAYTTHSHAVLFSYTNSSLWNSTASLFVLYTYVYTLLGVLIYICSSFVSCHRRCNLQVLCSL